MICKKCGAESPEGSAFCGFCGAPLESAEKSQNGQFAQPQNGQFTQPQNAPQNGQFTQPQNAPQNGQFTQPQNAPQNGQSTQPQNAPQSGQSTQPQNAPQSGMNQFKQGAAQMGAGISQGIQNATKKVQDFAGDYKSNLPNVDAGLKDTLPKSGEDMKRTFGTLLNRKMYLGAAISGLVFLLGLFLPFGYISAGGISRVFHLWDTDTGWVGVIILLILSLGVIAFSCLQKRKLLFSFGIALPVIYLIVFFSSTYRIYKSLLGASLVHLSVGHSFLIIGAIAACVFGVLAFLRKGEKK